jgi:hypothetical protein
MDNITQIINLSYSLEYNVIIALCNKLLNIIDESTNQELNFIEELDIDYLITISLIPYYIKHADFELYLISNPKIKFSCIEDWKNENKFNSIMLLIVCNYLNESNLRYIIGNQSKKIYKNGSIIEDNSLALKKFFNLEYKQFRTGFYKNLDSIIKLIVKEGNDINLVEKTVYSMIEIIQADIACRTKYENGEYYDYKTRIADIVETRNKEDMLYNLFYKITYSKLLDDPLHTSLRCLLFDTWTITKEKYTWLTELITFINNNSENSKDYLINNIGISFFSGIDKKTKYTVIEEVVHLLKLNMKSIRQIINYIFSIANYYKHKTYNKWYTAELKSIELFNKYKENELEETLENLIKEINLNANSTNVKLLMNLMSEYYINLSNKL